MVFIVEQEIADPKRFWDERCPKTAIALPRSGDPPVQSALVGLYLSGNGLRSGRRLAQEDRREFTQSSHSFLLGLGRFRNPTPFCGLFYAV